MLLKLTSKLSGQLPMKRSSVLFGLKSIFHFIDQSCILSKSFSKLRFISSVSLEEDERDVSSAKMRVILIKLSAISFIKMRNIKGPRTDPLGTPAFVDKNRSKIIFFSGPTGRFFS